jgi:hypothetical protein
MDDGQLVCGCHARRLMIYAGPLRLRSILGWRSVPQGLVHARTSEGLEAAFSDRKAPSAMPNLDKTWATISRGTGSIDTTTGFSSGPGSSSASY